MNSNEHPSSRGRGPYQGPGYNRAPCGEPRPPVNEDTLKSGEIQVERKKFMLVLKENVRGRFLRITEEGGAKRNSIIVPASGLADFKNVVHDMVKALDALPARNEPAQDDGDGNC